MNEEAIILKRQMCRWMINHYNSQVNTTYYMLTAEENEVLRQYAQHQVDRYTAELLLLDAQELLNIIK